MLLLAQTSQDVRRNFGALERQAKKYSSATKTTTRPFQCRARSFLSIPSTSMLKRTAASSYTNYSEAIQHMRAALQLRPDL
jgi:hypothetical protein